MSAVISRFQKAPGAGWRGLRRTMARYRVAIILTPLLVGFLVLSLWPSIVVTVPAGHVAVRWWRFLGGTDISSIYHEGAHFNFPWDEMPIYDVRLQQISSDFDVLTLDGMNVAVNVAVRYRLDDEMVGLLHKNVGPSYVETLLIPSLGTYARQVFSQFAIEDGYAAKRLQIQDRIQQAITADLAPRLGADKAASAPWILVDNVLIRSMRFPPAVEAAINRKMEQHQVQEEYVYRLQRERLESERKRVEAEGIAQFQKIVGAGISPDYLRWKGIDATLSLAQSPNAKVVIIGTPKDGMPLILGSGDAATAGTVPAAVPPERAGGHTTK